MPFYVEYSTKRRTVAIRSASPVQFVICESFGYIVTIEAVLNDYINHRNVTFEWEQLKGTPVTLSHPNEPITTFEYTDASDKVFRFHIDKDTARETYIDVRVYHTPISFGQTGAEVSTLYGPGVVRIVGKENLVKVSYSRTIVTNVTGEPAIKFSLEYLIPTDIQLLTTKLELFYSPDTRVSPYILQDSWTDSYPNTYIGVEGLYLWAITVVYPSGIEKIYYSSVHISKPAPAVASSGDRIIDDIVAVTPYSALTSVNRFEYILRDLTESNGIGNITGLPVLTAINRYDNILTEVLTQYNTYLIIGYTIENTDITRYNPSGIGSSG